MTIPDAPGFSVSVLGKFFSSPHWKKGATFTQNICIHIKVSNDSTFQELYLPFSSSAKYASAYSATTPTPTLVASTVKCDPGSKVWS